MTANWAILCTYTHWKVKDVYCPEKKKKYVSKKYRLEGFVFVHFVCKSRDGENETEGAL